MRKGVFAPGLVAALATLGVLGMAVAQENPPAPMTTAEASTDAEEQLSPPEMLAKAKGFVPAMDRSATAVRRQLTLAREQRDVVKALCLNDKLNQIDLATRTATDRMAGLESAVSQNDAERSKHQFTVLQVLRERVTTLVSEANQCIGEETGFVGESNVTVEVDPNIPDTDPSEFPTDPIISNPPILSSGSMP
jgi:hypothetical protein